MLRSSSQSGKRVWQNRFIVLATIICGVIYLHSSPTISSAQQTGESFGAASGVSSVVAVTPTPVPGCQLYRIDFVNVETSGKDGSANWTREPELECLAEIWGDLESKHRNGYWQGSRLWAELLKLSGSERNGANYQANKKYVDCLGEWRSPRRDRHNGHAMIGGGAVGGKKGTRTPGCSRGKLFVNDSCELQEPSKVEDEVGECYASLKVEVATPISLIWAQDYKNLPSTIVKFKLHPDSDATDWMWRASSALPLLVFDAAGDGQITSARQLFGNWFDGGKTGDSTTPWENGFEALQTLDKDKDGGVSGDELSNLSLWFDDNRDGISQKGEVRPAVEMGITHLYYQPDGNENGAAIASRGFTRRVEGKVINGSSIDWIEKSIHEATLDGLAGNTSPSSDTREARTSSSEPVEATEVAQNEFDAKIRGTWVVELPGDRTANSLLTFDGNSDGMVGTTIRVNGLQNVAQASAEVIFSSFSPTMTPGENSTIDVSFDMEGLSGSFLKNFATLSADGTVLKGKTIVQRSANSTTGNYEYEWTARRL